MVLFITDNIIVVSMMQIFYYSVNKYITKKNFHLGDTESFDK